MCNRETVRNSFDDLTLAFGKLNVLVIFNTNDLIKIREKNLIVKQFVLVTLIYKIIRVL